MRKLQTKDIFAFCRCIKSIGVKDEINKLCKNADTITDIWDQGFELVYNIFEAASEKSSEAHVYEFLAGPFEMTANEVEELEVTELFKLIKQLAAENNLVNFFKSASALTK